MPSTLQRQILRFVLREKFATTNEILTELWGWPADKTWGTRVAGIGEDEYGRRHGILSRSLIRLWQRGLVEIWKTLSHGKTAISLTKDGIEVAESLKRG